MRQHTRIPVALALAMLSLPAGSATARSTERESLLNRCWVEGIAKAGPDEARPLKNAKGANVPVPSRHLGPFTPIEAARRGAIRRVVLKPGSKKLIALTFRLIWALKEPPPRGCRRILFLRLLPHKT